MSFSGIFRSKNRRNRKIYDPEPVSPKDEATCNCISEEVVEQVEDTEACKTQEPCAADTDCGAQCQPPEADCCEEVYLEETNILEVCQEEADKGYVSEEEVCTEEEHVEDEHCEQAGC